MFGNIFLNKYLSINQCYYQLFLFHYYIEIAESRSGGFISRGLFFSFLFKLVQIRKTRQCMWKQKKYKKELLKKF